MSRMNAAWSNEPPWAEAVPAIFKEPMTIAFGGAILAHAIFFLGLPVVAGSEKQPDVQPVATTILTDQDKAQIPPDLSQSQFPAGTLLPGSSSGLTMPPIPSGTTPPATNFGNLPGGGLTFDPPSYTYNPPANDSSAALAEIRRQQAQQEADRQQQIKKIELAQKQAAEKKADQERANTPPGPLPNVPVNAMPPGTPTGETPKTPPTPTSPTPAQQPIRVSDKTLIDADPTRYALVPENTGPSLGVKLNEAIGTWYKRDPKTQAIYDRDKNGKQLAMLSVKTQTGTLPYPKQIGKQDVAVIPGYAEKVKAGSVKERLNAYGTAIVGIAVDGQGKLVIEPSIIQSTGYKVLDEYAIQYVMEYAKSQLRITGKDEFYFMPIPIDPPSPTAQQAAS